MITNAKLTAALRRGMEEGIHIGRTQHYDWAECIAFYLGAHLGAQLGEPLDITVEAHNLNEDCRDEWLRLSAGGLAATYEVTRLMEVEGERLGIHLTYSLEGRPIARIGYDLNEAP